MTKLDMPSGRHRILLRPFERAESRLLEVSVQLLPMKTLRLYPLLSIPRTLERWTNSHQMAALLLFHQTTLAVHPLRGRGSYQTTFLLLARGPGLLLLGVARQLSARASSPSLQQSPRRRRSSRAMALGRTTLKSWLRNLCISHHPSLVACLPLTAHLHPLLMLMRPQMVLQ